MKNESQQLFFLATENVAMNVKKRYQIQEGIIEVKNFVPEAFLIHQLQNENRNDGGFVIEREMTMMSAGVLEDRISAGIHALGTLSLKRHLLELADQDDDDKKPDEDEDWDEEDEDWDEEDEDWDEEDEDEDWDEEDEDWDEDVDDEDWDKDDEEKKE